MTNQPSNPPPSISSGSAPRPALLRRLVVILASAQFLLLGLNVLCRITYRTLWPTAGIWLGAGSLAAYLVSYALSARTDTYRRSVYLLAGAAYTSSVALDAVAHLSGGSVVGYAMATLAACLLLSAPVAAGVASVSAATHLILQVASAAAESLPSPSIVAALTDSIALATGLGALILFAEAPLGDLTLLPTWTSRSLRRLLGTSSEGLVGTAEAVRGDTEPPAATAATPPVHRARLLEDDAYRQFFEASPSPLWEMDLSELRRSLEELESSGVTDVADVLREDPRAVRALTGDLRIGRMNSAALVLFCAEEVATARRSLPDLLGRHCPDVVAQVVAALASGRTAFQMTCTLPTLAGEAADVVLAMRVAPGSEGTWDTVLASATDVSEHLRAEETLRQRVERYVELVQEQAGLANSAREDARRKEELLREVSHRTKNNLASIMGLLYAEARHAGASDQSESEALAYDVARRVQGLVTVHDLLSDSHWQPLPLDSLLRAIIDGAVRMAPSSHPVTATVSHSTVLVSPREANTLALVVNELAVNAVKHALREGSLTRIGVHIHREGEEVVIAFRDSGKGYPDQVLGGTTHGHGLLLVRNMVSQELKGELLLRNDGGAVATIRFTPRDPATDV